MNNCTSNHRRLLCVFVFLAVVTRLTLVQGLPIWARDSVGADEYLMLEEAENLLNGHYLGTYDELRLTKGIVFPVFLATINFWGISYIDAVSVLQCVSCLLFLYVCQKFIQNKIVVFLSFITLLFMPTVLADIALVYRIIFCIPFVIFLMCSLMMMYVEATNRLDRFAIWAVSAGIALSILTQTREDMIWTIPLFIVFIIVGVYKIITHQSTNGRKFMRVIILCVPLILSQGTSSVISLLNYRYYGIFTTNELNDTAFHDAYSLMMKVKPEEEKEYVVITRETLERLFAISPTLAELQPAFERIYDQKEPLVIAGRNPDNGELNENFVIWCLRGEAAKKGYYSDGITANTYWKQVAEEIQNAIDQGILETRMTLGSASIIPWPTRETAFQEYCDAVLEVLSGTITYNNVWAAIPYSGADVSEDIIRRYEAMTGNLAVRKDEERIEVNGWAFSTVTEDRLFVELIDKEGDKKLSLLYQDSPDLIEGFFQRDGIYYTNASKARFSAQCSLSEIKHPVLLVKNVADEVVGTVDLLSKEESWVNGYEHGIEIGSVQHIEDPYVPYITKRIARIKTILSIYQAINPILMAVAFLSYVFATFLLVIKKVQWLWEKWLFASALLGCCLVCTLGLAWVHAFMFDVVNGYSYSVSILQQMFASYVVAETIAYVVSRMNNERKKEIA